MTYQIKIDPWNVSGGDTSVDREEFLTRHNPPAPAKGMGGEGMTLGIMDTGIARTNDTLVEQYDNIHVHDSFVSGASSDAIGHGTAVADAATRYATGATLRDFKIFNDDGETNLDAIMEALDVAIIMAEKGQLDVLNMSWGSMRVDKTLDRQINALARAGCVPVVAAGNSGGGTGSPASAEMAISVGALQEEGQRMTNFSSWDQDDDPDPGTPGVPEVCAIGKNILLARANGTSMGKVVSEETVKASGTSFSAPFVSGLIIDLLRRRPDLTPRQVLWLLEVAAVDIPGTHRDGLGRVNWADTITTDEEDLPWMQTAEVYSLPYIGGRAIRVSGTEPRIGQYEVNMDKLLDAMQRQEDAS